MKTTAKVQITEIVQRMTEREALIVLNALSMAGAEKALEEHIRGRIRESRYHYAPYHHMYMTRPASFRCYTGDEVPEFEDGIFSVEAGEIIYTFRMFVDGLRRALMR